MHKGRCTASDRSHRRLLNRSSTDNKEDVDVVVDYGDDTLGDLYSSFINDATTDPFCPHGKTSDADDTDRLIHGRRPPSGVPSRIESVRFGTPFVTPGSVVSRPMTAVRAVGFTSRKSLVVGGGGSLTRLSSNSGGGSASGSCMAPSCNSPMAASGTDDWNVGGDVLGGAWSMTPDCRLTKLEKTINELLNQSYHASSQGDKLTALEKAKEADKEQRHYFKTKNELMPPVTELIADDDKSDIDLIAFPVACNLGNQYATNKMYGEALRVFEGIVKNKEFPRGSNLRINIANIHFALGDYRKAVKLYKMALDKVSAEYSKTKVKILGNIVMAFIKMRKFNEALLNLQPMMIVEPSARTAFHILLCKCILRQPPSAIKQAFQDLIKVDLEVDDDWYVQHSGDDKQYELILEVIRTDDLRRYEQALKSDAESNVLLGAKIIAPLIEPTYQAGYDWCIQQVSNSTQLSNLTCQLAIEKALRYLRDNEFDRVNETLASLENDKVSVNCSAATNLAFLFSLATDEFQTTSSGHCPVDLSAAERYANQAVQMDRYNPAALVNKGNIFYSKRDIEKALHMYMSATQVDPMCAEAWYNLGLCHKHLDRDQVALGYFEKLLTMMRNNPQVLYHVADLHALIGRPHEALQRFIQLLSVVPTDAGVLCRIGELYDMQGDRLQALHYFNDSFRHDPTNVNVIRWLGGYHVSTNYMEKAIKFFERGALIQPNVVFWSLTVGACHLRENNLQMALQCYRSTFHRFPDNAPCLKKLAHLCRIFGHNKEAEEYEMRLIHVLQIARLREEQLTVHGYRDVSFDASEDLRLQYQMLADDRNRQSRRRGGERLDASDTTSNDQENMYGQCDGAPWQHHGKESGTRIRRQQAADDFSNEVIGDDLLPL